MTSVYLHFNPAAALSFLSGAVAGIAAVSFWLTVALAGAGSLLSAMCIADPVSHPQDDSCYFSGQWLVWLATPLLWGTVLVSLAFEQLKPVDLVAILLIACISRVLSRAICDLKLRAGGPRRSGFMVSTIFSRE
jgi:hypothetical protein